MDVNNLNGLYAEVEPRNINEGEMLVELGEAIRSGVRRLNDHWNRHGNRKGHLEIALKIQVAAAKDSVEHVSIQYVVASKLPVNAAKTLAKLAGGRLIAQPNGSNPGEPEQLALFDHTGMQVKTLDLKTGEAIETKAVAGKVGA